MNKKEILDYVIKNQIENINSLKNSITIYKTAADIDEDNTLDPEDFSHQEEARDMQFHLEEKLKKENSIIDNIKKYQEKTHSTIEEGTLIETNLAYIYLGIVTNSFSIDNKDVYCISLDAPLAKIISKKKIGDSFKIGDVEHTILKVS